MRIGHHVRITVILAFGLSVCGIIGGWGFLVCRPSQVTRESFLRLTNGMSEADVVEVFGEKGELWFPHGSNSGERHSARWIGDVGVAYVTFDNERGLVEKQWHEDGFASPTKDSFHRIDVGMAKQDVTKIFGRPPDRARRFPTEDDFEEWSDIDGDAFVSYGGGRVCKRFWHVWRDDGIDGDRRHPFRRFMRRLLFE
jgi:hypothetical protein